MNDNEEKYDPDYELFLNSLKKEVINDKKSSAKHIIQYGNTYLEEIERKRLINERKKNRFIEVILKKFPLKYDYEELFHQSYEDIRILYNELIKPKQSFFRKILKLFFNN
jgi:hypothetical protein